MLFLRKPLTVRESVVVHTNDGGSFAGVLLERHNDSLVLAHARWLREDGQNLPLDGECVFPADNVAFVQRNVKVDDSRPA